MAQKTQHFEVKISGGGHKPLPPLPHRVRTGVVIHPQVNTWRFCYK